MFSHISTEEKKITCNFYFKAKMQLSTILTYIVKKIIDYSLKKIIKSIANTLQSFHVSRRDTHMQVEFTTWILNPMYNVNHIASAGNYLIFNQKTCSLVLKIPKSSVFLEG